MATAVEEPKTTTGTCGLGVKDAGAPPLNVTVAAAEAVKQHIEEASSRGELEPGSKYYLRVRVQGGGCSGFQNKLDLDTKYDEKTDHLFHFHGIEVVVDKRSLLYLGGATVDFHSDLNKRGFSVTNPQAKGTCGCGSSYSM